ncbi:MGH1-like glycoside hydrolase domain-containing protein [Rhodanobacter sp. BL-MT-08]
MLSLLLTAALAAGAATPTPQWQDGLDWHGVHVAMTRGAQGSYTLAWPYGQRAIAAQAMRVDTASTLFDGLFAMAQNDLAQDSVSAIRDDAFDHGQPIPCQCFETGLKWPYVWTRDLSYAVDLGLWRFDPARSRNGLQFKLSKVRLPAGAAASQSMVMQDTGSGGSWPISTDRVVWFLGARHLLDDPAFAAQVYPALRHTLAQDRTYAFDARFGLYRGETSFLDWREQSYPAWTQNNVVAIAQSFALSTNVLHYGALQMAAALGSSHGDSAAAADYRAQAAALKSAINARFWRDDRHLYMSYIGGDGTPYDSYDLLGIALAITSGVAEGDRARQALANYPTWPAGSPVIWPERVDQPIYHNRAIWPFVSAYALRAARRVDDAKRIAHELQSIMRGAALYGSNMENYELLTQGQHLDDGSLSGPVVNSPRQLWSVAAYLAAVTEGVFGLNDYGRVEPKLPTSLVPMLFGARRTITLTLPKQSITLQLPSTLGDGNLLVADHASASGATTLVTLKAIRVADDPLRTDAPLYAPVAPDAPIVTSVNDSWHVRVDGKATIYLNGQRLRAIDKTTTIPKQSGLQCMSATRVDADGLESLQSPATCVGNVAKIGGAWPRQWTAAASGRYRVWLSYANDHGPINTGITAAVKMLVVQCGDGEAQRVPLVMPHSLGEQASTYGEFTVKAGNHCSFNLDDGFNMSYLAHFAHYTGGAGGDSGPLNDANIHDLQIALLAPGNTSP